MSALVFCKFNHRASLQARGDFVRIVGFDPFELHQGYSEFRLSAAVNIEQAVMVRENVVHVLTTDGIFEINGEHGIQVTKIGETL